MEISFLIRYLVFINIITMAVFGIDKYQAIRHRRRIRVATLFFLTLIGGSVGALSGMYLFRHKTKKAAFTVGVPLILFVHVLLLLLVSRGWIL